MNEKIVNVYKIESEKRIDSYIFSIKKTNNSLGFDYNILTKDKNNNPIIKSLSNTIEILQNSNIHLIPIEKEEYITFIELLSKAININNSQKKEETLSRK